MFCAHVNLACPFADIRVPEPHVGRRNSGRHVVNNVIFQLCIDIAVVQGPCVTAGVKVPNFAGLGVPS